MPNGFVSLERLTAWLARYRELIVEQRIYLTELDADIGDGDHGANMSRGVVSVMEKLEAEPPTTAEDLFKKVGMTLVTAVGGASGPLYGTFFLRLSTGAGPATELDAPTFARALRAGLDGVLTRGKPELGDKTMFDAMAPAVDALEQSLASGSDLPVASAAAFAAAELGRDATKPMVGRKGRASYLGDRSVGHVDPGAASTALLFQALAEVLTED